MNIFYLSLLLDNIFLLKKTNSTNIPIINIITMIVFIFFSHLILTRLFQISGQKSTDSKLGEKKYQLLQTIFFSLCNGCINFKGSKSL